jgi:hypothetical protein
MTLAADVVNDSWPTGGGERITREPSQAEDWSHRGGGDAQETVGFQRSASNQGAVNIGL